MDTIRFANGAVFECSYLSTSGEGRATIALADVDYPTAARIFSDENMTREMEWGNYRLVGYTQLTDLCLHPSGIMAVLRGGHDERLS